MVSLKPARVDSGKYFIFQYQENISMIQSQALAKAESTCPFLTLAWSFTLGRLENNPMARSWPQFQRCTWMAPVPWRWPAVTLLRHSYRFTPFCTTVIKIEICPIFKQIRILSAAKSYMALKKKDTQIWPFSYLLIWKSILTVSSAVIIIVLPFFIANNSKIFAHKINHQYNNKIMMSKGSNH